MTQTYSFLHKTHKHQKTPKNTKNHPKIAKNTLLTITPSNNNTTKHTNTNYPLAIIKTSYSIAISNNILNISYNSYNTNNKAFKQKSLKNQLIANIHPIAINNNLNYQNIELRNILPIITPIAIENSEKPIIHIISIVKIKTIINPLIAKTLIASSIKIATEVKKPIKIHDYLDNSLVDK